MRGLVRPPRLQLGNCIGIFTPSSPLHTGAFLEKFEHGKAMLERAGFKVKLGSVTASGKSEGYRSASPMERAREFMDLYLDPTVHGLMSTVGGYNTSSFIDHLDYEAIRLTPKVVVGYSDVTSLHCAILTRAGISTFYGPALFPSFGEWPEPAPETLESFMEAVAKPWTGPRIMKVPSRWSRHFRNATNGDWKTIPRQWVNEAGWRVIRPGMVEGPLYALNLNTLLTHTGTNTFPDLEGAIVILEEMDAPLARTERSLVHLSRLGVFERVRAVVWGRVENPDPAADDRRYEELLKEFIPSNLPLVTEFDVSHTVPMLTIGQGARTLLNAPEGGQASLTILEPLVVG